MRIKVGILVNEIVLPLPNKNKSSFHANGPFATASIEITVFGKYKRTRSYGIVSPSTPILPCEQLHFSKDFIGYPSIGDLLRSFEREPFSMRLIVEHPDIPQYSNSHREVVAEYEDNALNVFYPYHTLHPSYDHVTRRLHLNCLKPGIRPVLTRLTLSVSITGDEPTAGNSRSTPPSADKRSSSRSRSQSRLSQSHRPPYMEPTFSWLMSEQTTRQQFFPSPSTDQLRMPHSANGDVVRRIPRSASDYVRREY